MHGHQRREEPEPILAIPAQLLERIGVTTESAVDAHTRKASDAFYQTPLEIASYPSVQQTIGGIGHHRVLLVQ